MTVDDARPGLPPPSSTSPPCHPPSNVTVSLSSASMQHTSLPLLLSLLVLLPYTAASPKERLKVKYRLKQGERQKVLVKALPQEGELVRAAPLEDEPTDLLNQVDGRELVAEARELLVAATPGAYRDTVTTMIGQMERAARSSDTTLGDLILDVVMEVFTETVSGVLARSLGLSTARSSGSFMDTVIRAVSTMGQPKSC